MQNYITLMTQELARWFDVFNEELFNSSLPECAITIQKTRPNILGYATTAKVWKPLKDEDIEPEEAECQYEICISANNLRIQDTRTIYDICATLVHEQCHIKALYLEEKDCSGKIHNKKFKRNAENAKLIVGEKDRKVGYGFTSPSEELKKIIDEKVKPNISIFNWYRIIPIKPIKDKEPQKKFKKIMWCPDCELEIKLEERLDDYEGFGGNIACPECGKAFEEKPKGKRGRKAKGD